MYFQCIFTEVDILPFQPADLTAAKSRHDFDIEERIPVFLSFNGFKECFRLTVAEYLFFGIVALGNGRSVRRIFYQKSLPDGNIQGFMKHQMRLSDHTVCKRFPVDGVLADTAFFLDLVIEFLNVK